MAGEAKERLDFLQAFRALAAVIVSISHMATELLSKPRFANSATLYWGHSLAFGVDIFFIISGFIMVYTTANAAGGRGDAMSFFRRRLIRIVPVYWLYTSLFLAVVLLHPSSITHSNIDIQHVLASYFFIPMTERAGGEIAPVYALGWTLNYEMFFYAVFALVLLAPRRHLMPILAVLFVTLVVIGLFVPQSFTAVWYWTRSSILEFLFGAVIAQLYLRSFRLPVWLCVSFVLAGVALWQSVFGIFGVDAGDHSTRGLLWGIPAALMVSGVALCPPVRRIFTMRWAVPLVVVGDISYSLYLVHMFTVRAMTYAIPASRFGWAYPAVYIVLTTAATIGAAYLSYIWFEKPVHDLARRPLSQWKAVFGLTT